MAAGIALVAPFCGPVLADSTTQCVQDLCGATSNKTPIQQSAEQNARIDHDFESEIRRLFLLQIWAAIENSRETEELQKLALEKITQAEEIQVSDQLKVMANLKYVIGIMYTGEVYSSIAKVNGHAEGDQSR